MLSARVRIFHIRCLVDFARTYLMAYFLRRRLYILNTERQDRSSVVERDWPKDNSCVQKIAKPGKPMDLHRFWDGVITSSSNMTRPRSEATALRNRQEFQSS
jgi:hypothetical protein